MSTITGNWPSSDRKAFSRVATQPADLKPKVRHRACELVESMTGARRGSGGRAETLVVVVMVAGMVGMNHSW